MTGNGTYVIAPEERLERLKPTDGEHVLVATVVYRLSAEHIRSGVTTLDNDNFAMVRYGCWECGESYSESMRYRKCPGEPK